jgi:glycolate oxidase FAD binding subunit
MNPSDHSMAWQERIRAHHAQRLPLQIVGGNTKSFYGLNSAAPNALTTQDHRGIVHYEPSELVITARAGTPLLEIETTLAAHRQMLGFEPPHFGAAATLGGCVATGLSGPRRPYTGSVRDFVLGTTVINGKGERLHFGGEVMKNVAGYDVSRLYCGSMGTLGVILEVSLKVLPLPEIEQTQIFELTPAAALLKMQTLAQQSLPLSASCYAGQQLYVRLSGTERAVQHAQQHLGGERLPATTPFWHKLKEHTLPFFTMNQPLWRVAVPPAAPALPISGVQLIDWGGAQRWLHSDAAAETIFNTAQQLGGHATLFRGGQRNEAVFQPLHGKLKELHLNTKLAFDPQGILNRGRMYAFY